VVALQSRGKRRLYGLHIRATRVCHLTNLYLNSKLIAGTVKEARGYIKRMVGLIGKKEIEEGSFLLFRNCNAIHTFFMSASIDAVMTAKNGEVLRVFESLRPWRFAACLKARDTLEMKAGSARKNGIKAGDIISFS
jgi:uncharacterized membrane protein (UPF0127 family)